MIDDAAPAVIGTRRRLLHTALTGLSQGVSFLGVAMLGLLIASQFGASAITDGFFIAQSVYAVALLTGQSMRTTAVAGLTERPQESPSESFGATGVLALVAGVAFGIAALLVPALTADLPAAGTHVAQRSLLLLWPAAALQLVAGVLAAILATRDRVAVAAAAYSAGALSGVVAFLPLRSAVGSTALPLVLVVGAVITSGTLAVVVARTGGLPGRRPKLRVATRRAGQLLLGAAGLIVAQLIVTSSVGLAGSVGEQAATTYSYSVMALNLVSATAVTPALVVLAPVLAAEWAGDVESLAGLAVRVFRFGVLLVVPVIAGVVLIGAPVLDALMPPSAQRTVPDIIRAILALSPTALATLLVIVPELGLVTRSRFGTLAGIGAAVLTFHVVVSLVVVSAGGGVVALAGTTAITATLSACIVTAVSVAGARRTVFGGAGRGLLQLALVPVGGYAVAGLVLGAGATHLSAGIVAWIAGSIVAGAWLLLTRRAELAGLLAMVRR